MSKKEKPRNSTSTKFIQSGTTTTTANCLILSSKSWSLYLQQDQADRQDPLVRVDQEDPTNTQRTSTQTMSKTTNQQWYDKQQRWTVLIHINWHKSASLTCSPLPPLAPFWPCSPTSPCIDKHQTNKHHVTAKTSLKQSPEMNDHHPWYEQGGGTTQ